jgi:MFS family permease
LVLLARFRHVLAAEVVSNFGSMLTRLVIPWIATLTLDATPLQMGLLVAADVGAGAVGALLLGALVDRLSARRVMVAADLLRAGLVGMIALAAWRGWVSMALLIVVALADGLATMAFELARSVWIAQNIEPAALPKRNAQLAAAGNMTEAVSFGVGGWIYQALGGALSLAVDAASYVVSALCLARAGGAGARTVLPTPQWPQIRNLSKETRAGIATLAREPTLRGLALVHSVVAFGMSVAGTSYMIYVARDLALGTGVLGMIFAVGGAGSAFGAMLAPRIGRLIGSRRAVVLGLGIAGLGSLLIPLATAPALRAIGFPVGHQLIGDAGYVLHDVHDRTLRQSIAPDDQLARVDAGIRTLGQLATLAGALAGAVLATLAGARAALFLAAAALVGATWLAQVTLATNYRRDALAELPPR